MATTVVAERRACAACTSRGRRVPRLPARAGGSVRPVRVAPTQASRTRRDRRVVVLIVVANLAWFGYRSQDTSTGSRRPPGRGRLEVFPPEDAVDPAAGHGRLRPPRRPHGRARDRRRSASPRTSTTGDSERRAGRSVDPGPARTFQELPQGHARRDRSSSGRHDARPTKKRSDNDELVHATPGASTSAS